jgi:hypothetical protein
MEVLKKGSYNIKMKFVAIFEILKSLHKCRIISPVKFEAQTMRIEHGDPNTMITLSTSALAIGAAS